MILKWHGHSCFEITLESGKKLITDPFDNTVGYPMVSSQADGVLVSHDHFDHNCVSALKGQPLAFTQPGLWHFGGATIQAVSSFHDNRQGALRGQNLIFVIEDCGLRLVHLGDLGHLPETDAQKAILKNCDVLLIPIGGTYTLTTDEAIELIKTYAPRAAIAMHYRNAYCQFDITTCDDFVKKTGATCLANPIEIIPGSLTGCHTMAL